MTVLFIIVSLPAYAQTQLPKGNFSDLRETGKARVIEIINPVTLLLDSGQIARLSGINIPSDEGKNWDLTARDIIKNLLLNQRVHIYQTKDKNYGRMNRMGHVLVHLNREGDNAWVQGVLLSLGLARVETSDANPQMADQMYAIEDQARMEKIGIWGDDSFQILSPEDTEPYIGQFAIVEGIIQSVTLKQNRIYMNFGGNWRDDFTVSIAPEDKRKFSKAGLDILNWGGKSVQVRGTLISKNGSYIEINHPQAIRLLEKESVEDLNEAP